MTHHDKDKKKRKYLHNVEVSHVSIVDHPANQRAFQIIKRKDGAQNGEPTMHVTLKNPFRKSDAHVTSVIATDEARGLAAASVLINAECTVRKDEESGLYEIRKTGTQSGDHEQLVKPHDEEFGLAYTVVAERITKALDLFGSDSKSFNEVIQKESFVPGLMSGLDALHTTIANIAMSEDTNSAEAFRTAVEDAVDDFKKYIGGMITSLPETAFKFEKAVVASGADLPEGATRPLPGGFDEETYNAIFGPAARATGLAPASAEEAEGSEAADAAAVAEGQADASEGEAQAEVDAAAAHADDSDKDKEAVAAEATEATEPEAETEATDDDDPQPTDSVDFEKALAAAMAAVTKSVGETIAAALQPVTEAQARTDAAVAKLSKTMGSTVVSEPEADGAQNVVDLRKEATSGHIPLLDTAYSRKNRNG